MGSTAGGSTGAVVTFARVAALCRAEQLVFAVLGDGATRFPEPSTSTVMVSAADHAAWRARRWYELLPTAPPGPDARIVPVAADHDVTAAVRAHGVDAVTLVAIATRELLPHARRAVLALLDDIDPVADAAVGRIARIALTDLEDDLAGLLGAAGSPVSGPADRDRADAAVAAVTGVIARVGWPAVAD